MSLALLAIWFATPSIGRPAPPAAAVQAMLIENVSEPFGTFAGVEYLRHSGRFVGTTELGDFRMPYEIIAPAIPELGNRTVLVEPPHFAFGPLGREIVFGRPLLFERGFSYAAVGFGTNGLNIMYPSATDLILAGGPPPPPPGVLIDEEIIVQFTRALSQDAYSVAALGAIDRTYAYGASQTAAALLETLHSPGGTDLFDLTLLHVAFWRDPFVRQDEFQRLDGEFQPLADVGRVIFVGAEGDQVRNDAEQFRRAVGDPSYRVYEVAGAAHLPSVLNPLDHLLVMRAIFVAADEWMRLGMEPPPSTLMESAPEGEIDPVYGFVTGIARDGDRNARGGVRLPEVEISQAQYIAVNFALDPLIGATIDLTCEPVAGSGSEMPRFANHGDYVSRFIAQTNELVQARFLLPEDAEAIKTAAAESNVGKPGSCG